MQHVLLDRSEAVQRGRLPRWATHLTSNNPLELADATPGLKSLPGLYGEPTTDGLYELCNITPLGGLSRRDWLIHLPTDYIPKNAHGIPTGPTARGRAGPVLRVREPPAGRE